MRSSSLRTLALLPCLAQLPAAAQSAATAFADLRVPIHHSPAGHEDQGLWAAGPGYKVRFADGFTFHPLLGADAPESLPLSWRTESVRAGGKDLCDLSARAARSTEWRYELTAPGLIEAYDVLPEGVEQSFVLTARPPDGDLVIEGSVATPLTCPALPASPNGTALPFADRNGRDVVRYGAATVIDAAGNRGPVAMSFAGGRITLTVAGSWLAAARFPVTVDPLTSATVLNGWSGAATAGGVASTAIAVDPENATQNHLIVFSRAWSATDRDVYGIVCNADYTSPHLIFVEASTVFDAPVVAAAHVAGAHRWLIAVEQRYSAPAGVFSRILVYFHDAGNTTLNSGLSVPITPVALQSFRNPVLGGSHAINGPANGLLLYTVDNTTSNGNTDHTEVVGAPIDAGTRTVLAAFLPAGFPVYQQLDRESPAVNPVAYGSDGWLVAWQHVNRTAPLPVWHAAAVRITPGGGQLSPYSSQLTADSTTRNAVQPKVAGNRGHYVVTFGLSPTLASTLPNGFQARTITWIGPEAAPAPSPFRVLTAPVNNGIYFGNESLAADFDTGSHWAATCTAHQPTLGGWRTSSYVARLGGTAAVTESQVLYASSSQDGVCPSAAYDSFHARFPIVYSASYALGNGEVRPVLGTHLTYPADALSIPYGTGCGQGGITAWQPFAGNANFALALTNGPANTAGILFLSRFPDSTPLDSAGLPGCVLDVSLGAGYLLTLTAAANAAGTALFHIGLPDVPLVTGDVMGQIFYLNPGANALGVQATRGLKVQIR